MGRSHPGTRSPDKPSSPTSSGITEHSPNIFRAFPGISGHEMIVACRIVRRRIASWMARRVPYRPSPDRVPDGSSRAVSSVAGSRAVNPVACRIVCRRIAYRMARCGGIARRRIACRQSRRVRYRPSPDTAGGMVVTCGIARRRIACRIARRSMTFRRVRSCLSPDHVSSHPGPPRRPHVSAMLTVGPAEGPSSATPRPNSRL